MLNDCVIAGGGPAGMNAALVLGRAGKTVLVLDNDKPGNGVTRASHGFITREKHESDEFRRLAREEVLHYPSVQCGKDTVVQINREVGMIQLVHFL